MSLDGSTDNPYKVFHSSCEKLRKRLHVVLVEPENPGNVGAVCRAVANMGVEGTLHLVGPAEIAKQPDAERMAKHAKGRLAEISFHPTLASALDSVPGEPKLSLAATARIGSAHRPHPLWCRDAMQKAMEKMFQGEIERLFLVFGRESSGLTNEEVALCDWVVTIPSTETYRSLNLAQSVMVFAYEANHFLTRRWDTFETPKPSQKQRLVTNLMQLAEETGFILPNDPHKMKPRLEEILGHLPNHIKYVKTIHGFIDQLRRSVRKGAPDIKGRYKQDLIYGKETR